MKKVIILVCAWGTVAAVGFTIGKANVNVIAAFQEPIKLKKPHCTGYTIIEAGKGLDCYGDTVKLVKTNGYYQLASRYEKDQREGRVN